MSPAASHRPADPLRPMLVSLTALIAEHDAMQEVLDSARDSDTPHAPLYLKPRADMVGRFELADGHHHVAAALRSGITVLPALVEDQPDDEPYQPPFFDFTAAASATATAHR